MYDFNPMTSMELLRGLRQVPCPPAVTIADDPERPAPSPRHAATFGDLVRRVIQRFACRNRAA